MEVALSSQVTQLTQFCYGTSGYGFHCYTLAHRESQNSRDVFVFSLLSPRVASQYCQCFWRLIIRWLTHGNFHSRTQYVQLHHIREFPHITTGSAMGRIPPRSQRSGPPWLPQRVPLSVDVTLGCRMIGRRSPSGRFCDLTASFPESHEANSS